MEIISHLTLEQWLLSIAGAVLIGFGKSGIKGMGPVIVTLMVLAFGGKASTGLIMPLLITGDVIAVIYYRKFIRWEILFKVLPWMAIGVLLGALLGKELPEVAFRKAMSITILISAVLMILSDLRKSEKVPKHWAFATILGLLAGFTSMVGNLAGAFANLFFLSLRISKEDFIGTAAWLYLFINLLKLTFHVFSWQTVNAQTLPMSLLLIIPLILGLLIGFRLVKLIKPQSFRRFVIIATAIGAIVIFFR